ncbi:MAG TPA: M56 family metallopeptidase [Candidatus Acidoferrales bacterium]|jgi:beta-lactamase regulating signal transducer with metallopeptidase domain|nr:M56 family metallopeptidase [Candidatus Acidoferrales bacterium]
MMDIHASTNFLITLAGAAVRSLALGCLAAAALALFRTKSVRVRLFVWKGVLLAALAMPVLMLVGPTVRVAVPVPSLAERSPAGSAPVTESTVTDVGPVAHLVPSESSKHARRTRGQRRSDAAPIISEAGLPIAPVPVPKHREIPWVLIVFSAYAVTAAALFVRVLVGIYFSNRLVRFALSVDEPWALRTLAAASRAAGLRDDPYLAESETLAVPVMVGVIKPTILLTPGWQEWDSDEFAAVLAHEVSHVARRDALAQVLALIHRAIFWFSPLAWWLERHLANLAEQASDEAALAGGMDRTRYAQALLGFFAELEAGQERVWWQGVSMAKAGQAEKRVDRILAWRGAMSNKLTKSLTIALVVVAAPMVALTAAVRPATYDIQAPPAPTAPPAPAAPDPFVAAPSPGPDPIQAPAPPTAPAPPADSEEPGPEIRMIVPPIPAMPPLQVQVPMMHIAIPDIQIDRGMGGGYWAGRYNDWGPRFAIVTKNSDELTMSGDRDDAEHARALRKKIPGDFIWFEHDEKSYIISDQATVDRAKKLWQPDEDLEKQQKDLGKQQEDLAKQAADAGKKIDEMKIQVPDLSAEMQKVEQAMKKLNAEGGTVNELGDLQNQIGELQGRIGEIESSAGRAAGDFGREQGEWGRKMGALGRQQGELARKQAERSRDAARQMQELLDDAIAHGLAKPE